MTNDLATLAHNKLMCTGVPLAYTAPEDPPPVSATEEEFDSLVSSYNVLYREELVSDVKFLRRLGKTVAVDTFDRTVYQLRTAKQHRNPAADAFYKIWVASGWVAAGTSFVAEWSAALSELVAISNRVRRDRTLSKSWKENASVNVDSDFDAVCEDLGVRFSDVHRRRLLLEVKKERDNRQLVGTAVKNLCARIIGTQDLALPAPYYEVLDWLGLLRSAEARKALTLAYGIYAATGLTGDAFRERVVKAWEEARSVSTGET